MMRMLGGCLSRKGRGGLPKLFRPESMSRIARGFESYSRGGLFKSRLPLANRFVFDRPYFLFAGLNGSEQGRSSKHCFWSGSAHNF